jgi:hypothetical protein
VRLNLEQTASRREQEESWEEQKEQKGEQKGSRREQRGVRGIRGVLAGEQSGGSRQASGRVGCPRSGCYYLGRYLDMCLSPMAHFGSSFSSFQPILQGQNPSRPSCKERQRQLKPL